MTEDDHMCCVCLYRVKMLLSEAQGLRNGVEHPLPWYPPVCLSLLDLPKAGHGSYGHPTFLRDLDWSRSLPKITDPSMKPASFMTIILCVESGEISVLFTFGRFYDFFQSLN